MRKFLLLFGGLAFIHCFFGVAKCEEPEKVTVCQLKNDPPNYNHKLVEVEGFVSSDFEDFTLFDPTCRSHLDVWLEYGGKTNSNTMFCCGSTPNAQHPQDLVVEGLSISILDNKVFKEFDRQTRQPHRSDRKGNVLHATIIGRFFAGQKLSYRNGAWGGYGHMGCCSLFAIQEIKSVSPQVRDDLDYSASPDEPDWRWKFLTPIFPGNSVVEDQKQADQGTRAWSFNDPKRVASDAIKEFAKIEEPGELKLKATQQNPGRIDYEWRRTNTSSRYMVVVSRPYFLSFYARDPKMVAWVVVAAYGSPDPATDR
jgi:hypothetical protein